MDTRSPLRSGGEPVRVSMTGMPCRFCRHVNPSSAKYCNECGASIALQPCSACDAINSGDALVCHVCTAPLFSSGGDGLDDAEAKLAVLQRAHGMGDDSSATAGPATTARTAAPAGQDEVFAIERSHRHSTLADGPETDARATGPASTAAGLALADLPRRREGLGRRSQRPVLVLLAIAVLAVPLVLTRSLQDSSEPGAVRPTVSALPASTHPAESPAIGIAPVATSTAASLPAHGAVVPPLLPAALSPSAGAAADGSQRSAGYMVEPTSSAGASPGDSTKPHPTAPVFRVDPGKDPAERAASKPPRQQSVARGDAGVQRQAPVARTHAAAQRPDGTRSDTKASGRHVSSGNSARQAAAAPTNSSLRAAPSTSRRAAASKAPARAAGFPPEERCPRGTSVLAGCLPGA
jgi:hypothetical protein